MSPAKPVFSKKLVIAFALVFAVIGGYFIYKSFALGAPVARAEAETMLLPAGASVVNDSSASGGKAVLMTANGRLSTTISTAAPAAHINVTAKSNNCRGAGGNIQLLLDNLPVLGPLAVNSASYRTLSVDLSAPLPAGSHVLDVVYSNAYAKTKGKPCNRNLTVDVANLYGVDNPPPPPPATPTVALSANPDEISAGQSSTLAWTSTNADSCMASGAWSGPKATAGTASTGTLTGTAVFNLSCSGSGGTASASATVNVIPPLTQPQLYIQPSSLSVALGSTFTVEVRENSLSTAVNAVQANLSYPSVVLELVSIDSSTSAFTIEAQSTGGAGSIKIGRGIIGSLTDDKLVTKLTFKAVAKNTATVDFTAGSVLLDAATNQDILGSLSNTKPLTLQIN